jgi:multidrug resistance efflux pump
MFRKVLLPLFATAMLAFAIFHVVRAQQQRPKPDSPHPPALTPFSRTVAGTGVVEAETENIAIGTPAPGLVGEVLVRDGQQVAKGEPLFRLDDRQLEAELHSREAALHTAEAKRARLESPTRPEELTASGARVREARAAFREKEYFFNRGQEHTLSDDEMARRRMAADVTREQLIRAEAEHQALLVGAWSPDRVVARAAVEEARALVQQVRTELERLTVRAPVAGMVLQCNVRPGERIDALHGPPLIMGGTDRLRVRVEIDEYHLPRFQAGAPAKGILRGDPGREFALTFVRVVPLVVPKRTLTGQPAERLDTRVLQVLYALETGTEGLYVGQQMDVYVRGDGGVSSEFH